MVQLSLLKSSDKIADENVSDEEIKTYDEMPDVEQNIQSLDLTSVYENCRQEGASRKILKLKNSPRRESPGR